MSAYHCDEPLHVILDALAFFKEALAADSKLRPWEDYNTGNEDVKSSRTGYLEVLEAAEAKVTARLNVGGIGL